MLDPTATRGGICWLLTAKSSKSITVHYSYHETFKEHAFYWLLMEHQKISRRLPKGTWKDNSHKATCALGRHSWVSDLSPSRSLHFTLIAAFRKSRHFTVVGLQLFQFGGHCVCNFCLSMMARWRSRHVMVFAALGPQEVGMGLSKVVGSWLLQFHVLFRLQGTRPSGGAQLHWIYFAWRVICRSLNVLEVGKTSRGVLLQNDSAPSSFYSMLKREKRKNDMKRLQSILSSLLLFGMSHLHFQSELKVISSKTKSSVNGRVVF